MLLAKHAICFSAGVFGAVFGYVLSDSTWAVTSAFAGMFAYAAIADFLTQGLERNEDEKET